jgi:hypothetical protein
MILKRPSIAECDLVAVSLLVGFSIRRKPGHSKYVKLVASGEVHEISLDALNDYVERHDDWSTSRTSVRPPIEAA